MKLHSLLIVGLALCIAGCAEKKEPAPEPQAAPPAETVAAESPAVEEAPAVEAAPAAEDESARDAEFIDRARQRFGGYLGRFLKVGRRSSYPLRLVRAAEDIRPRAVILGNAAHAIHPIGAQGFNLGLRDAAVLAEVLADALRTDPGADIGGPEALRRYSEWRAPDQQGTIAYSDGLARLFANPTDIAAAARTVGMLAHAFLPPLRRQLAVRAMGFRGRTPRLALGEPL